MDPKPRPSVKKKAAAKELARANRLAAKQQAQEARAAAKEARSTDQEKTRKESITTKEADQERELAAIRDAERIRAVEQKHLEEKRMRKPESSDSSNGNPQDRLLSLESRTEDIARFSAAASKAQGSFDSERTDHTFDTQTISIADQENIIGQSQGEALRSPQRETTPNATAHHFAASEPSFDESNKDRSAGRHVRPSSASNDYSFTNYEGAIGMKAASSYKRKAGPLHAIAVVLGTTISVVTLAAIILVGTLTVKEFRPTDTSPVEVTNPSEITLEQDQQISLITWDIGYCALSSNADSFLYGGNSVRSVSASDVNDNLQSIEDALVQQDADFVLLQEVDQRSDRSHKIDEVAALSEAMAESSFSSAFAKDYEVFYVPYPIPPIGTIDSGILTQSKYSSLSAERISAYSPLKWPASTVRAKPCLLEERFTIEGSSKQLVIVNVNLGRYDNENDRAQQAAQLALIVKRETDKGNYIIVGGDFSQVFSNVSNPYPQTSRDLWQPGTINADAFEEGAQLLMDPEVPTMRSLDQAFDASKVGFQFYMTDGFIASENVQVESVETLDLHFENSNHNPVKLVVTLE